MRWIKGILKAKEWEKKNKARELELINREISIIESEIKSIEAKMEELNQSIKAEFSFEKLVEFKSLLAKKVELERTLTDLVQKKQIKQEELKSVYRDIKAVEVVKDRLNVESMRKERAIEMLRASFFYLIKKQFVFLVLIPSFVLAQGAIPKKAKEKKEARAESELKILSKELERKLKRLEEERKRLEELKRVEPKKEELPPNFQRLVAIFNKADPDEAGSIMNNMDPELAADILLKLKESQAAAILSAMDAQKAAQVSEIMARKKKKAP